HGLESRARYAQNDYEHYREVNRRFALNLRSRLLTGEVVWVHDYQLIPLGQELRALGWEGPVGYFHHVPIPAPNMWRRIPHARALAAALRHYSHIGVQTERDARHLRAILGRNAPPIEVHPIQVDAERVRASADAAPCDMDEAMIAGRTVLFGVDRLDYTKGLPQRLEAWELVLERRPDLRDRAVMIQWAAPSREGIDEYREERASIEAIAARIEERFGGEQSPLQLVVDQHSPEETAAALRRADIGVVTSIADGMNLVAKEFAALHSAEHPGVLVLSDGCGAVDELGASIVVDRRSVAAIADGIERALDMPPGERAGRSYALREAVDARDSADWAREITARIAACHHDRSEAARPCRTTPTRNVARSSVTRLEMPTALEASVDRWQMRMRAARMVERLWRRDASLWSGQPEAVSGRLGWLALDDWLADHLPILRAFALDIERAGYTTVAVLGMGGSSAAARVFARLGSETPRGLRVVVLDSTVPAMVRAAERQFDPGKTLFVVVSKSGETIETHAFMDHFWAAHPHGEDFVAITDPGTPLHEVALNRNFRQVFLNPPDVGGRFSALTYPGLLPAALAGLDLDLLASHARAMERACRRTADLERNPGARLAALLAEVATEERGTLFIETDGRLQGLDDWLSQLIAESTGKQGRGLLPVRATARAGGYQDGDTVFLIGEISEERVEEIEALGCNAVRCEFSDRHAIAAEVVRWEIGVALACALIEVNAFDEPDVSLAKRATASALAAGGGTAMVDRTAAELMAALSDTRDVRFIAIHAYLERTSWTEALLGAIQRRMSERFGVPVPVDFGPALLHATGQYYKGGPNDGLVIQVVEPGEDLPIPGRRYGFASLLVAQAQGDAKAMRAGGRRVVTSTLAALRGAAEGAAEQPGRERAMR
ncbi:MAG: trehalose-6-phosphate synthase, partial [Dehalococcoidia bacterium]